MAAQPLAIRAEGLWKTYRIHPPGTPRRLWRRPTVEFHALRDVNFEVPEGAVLGIVGHNGAGKSTLLKVLSRITDPSRGQVRVAGRVASLLEVGTGFHPDLTGLENLYLNAAIHGLRRSEVRQRLVSILEFAGIGDFLNEPVKHYSSGMYLRLAFSVAAHLDPDILIVDEILSVGDAEFQARCLKRFGELQREGRTVVVVSHDVSTIRRLCTTAMWLVAGQTRLTGDCHAVLEQYLRARSALGGAWQARVDPSLRAPRIGVAICLKGAESPVISVPASANFGVEFTVATPVALQGGVAVKVRHQSGVVVFTSRDGDATGVRNRQYLPGTWRIRCEVPGDLLTPGRYLLTVAVPRVDGESQLHEDVLAFEVTGDGSLVSVDGREGVVAPRLDWVCHRVDEGWDGVPAALGDSDEGGES